MFTSLSVRARVGVFAAVLVASGCATTGINRGDLNLISLDEEWQIGAQLDPQVRAQVRVIDDAALNQYVNAMGQRIVAQTELAGRPWRFHVVADRDLNAFNIPGGHVYVNTGLLAQASNASEVAGVLAHEITHGVSRHGTERMSKQNGASAVAGLVLGRNPGLGAQIATQVVAGGAFARFSRADEAEADRFGVRFMTAAGYNANGMVTMFQKLLSERRTRPGSVDRFFASHPLTEDRIASVQAEIRRQGGARGSLDDAAFARIHTAAARY